jgi:hypothetical protein
MLASTKTFPNSELIYGDVKDDDFGMTAGRVLDLLMIIDRCGMISTLEIEGTCSYVATGHPKIQTTISDRAPFSRAPCGGPYRADPAILVFHYMIVNSPISYRLEPLLAIVHSTSTIPQMNLYI